MSKDNKNDSQEPIVATPVGDPSREATASRRGYLYQDYRAALAWMELRQDQVLFLEIAEDVAIATPDSVNAIQVKDVADTLTLLEPGARRAIESFIDLRAKNSPKDVRLSFWTTAGAGIEKDTSHRAGEEGSIKYWIKASACPDVDVAPLKNALLRIGGSDELRNFLESRSPIQVRSDLIERIDWWIGREPIDDLRERLKDMVTAELQARRLTRDEALKRWTAVLDEVQQVSIRKDASDRRLTRSRLYSFLDDLCHTSIPIAQLRELQEKAEIAKSLPIEKLTSDIEHQVRGLRLWRRFVAFGAGAKARSLAHDVRSGGAYQMLEDATRAGAMALAARTLFDEDRDFSKQLLEESLRIAPSLESVVVAKAIFRGRADVSAGMDFLRGLDSVGANDARYMIQRADADPEHIARALTWYRDAGLVASDLSDDGNAVVLMDLLHSRHWDDAFELASELDDRIRDPFLTLQVALAALCRVSPEMHRSEIIVWPPTINAVQFRFDDTRKGLDCRRRARHLLEHLRTEAFISNLPQLVAHLNEYVLWLRLCSNNRDQQALTELEDLVNKTGTGGTQWIPLALSAGCVFDTKKARSAIDQHFHRVGAEDAYSARALLALLLADSHAISLDEWKSLYPRLAVFLNPDFLRTVEVSLRAFLGNPSDAEAVLNDIEDLQLRERVAISLKCRAFRAPEESLATVREAFLRTNGVQELERLVEVLGEAKQWTEMSGHASDLFSRTKAAIHAQWMLDALARSHQWEAVAQFFSDHTETGRGNVQIERLRAVYLTNESRWSDLDAQLERLKQLHPATETEIRATSALLSLRWDRLGRVIDSALSDINDWTPESLLRLARLARVLGREENSRSLIREAVRVSDGHPDVQFAAYLAASRAGWESENDAGTWLLSAVARSEESKTIQRMSLEDIAKQMPARRQHHELSWDLSRTAQIWLSLHAGQVNTTLGQHVLHAAIRNRRQRDPRKRSIVLAFSGARPPLEITAKQIVVDVSSLLTLALLGLLDKLPRVFEKVMVPHETGWWLAEELEALTFHQPSRILHAEERLKLLGTGRFSVCPVENADPRNLKILGVELAELVESAEKLQRSGSRAYVIRTAPIHIPGSHGAENVEPADVPGCIRSLVCLMQSLRESGYLTPKEFDRAQARLRNVDNGWKDERPIERSATLYLDDLTVTYLQDFKLMDAVLKSRRKLMVHSSLQRDAESYDFEKQVGEESLDKLSALRRFLEQGAQSGFVEVLPKPTARWGKSPEISAISMDLAAIAVEHDGVLVDDRFFNAHPKIGEKSVAMLTSLDVLDRLLDLGEIVSDDWFEFRTTLRRCGYALLPVTEAEMSRALVESGVDGESFVESVSFRAIRENAQLIQMREVLLPGQELGWMEMSTRSARRALGQALEHHASPIPTFALQDLANIELFGPCLALTWENEFRVLDLVAKADYLTVCLSCIAEKPSAAFRSGSSELFNRLHIERPRIHQEIADEMKGWIIKFSDDLRRNVEAPEEEFQSYWHRAISHLPASVARLVWNDEQLMERIKLPQEFRIGLSISGSPQFRRDQLWQAVIRAQDAGLAEVTDLESRNWQLRRDETGRILISDRGDDRPLAFDQELAHSNVDIRRRHFAARCATYAITPDSFSEIEKTLRARPLTAREIFAFQDALDWHPLSKERSIEQVFGSGTATLSELFPIDWDYYERLVGSWTNESNILAFTANRPKADFSKAHVGPEGRRHVAAALRRALLSGGHSSGSPRELVGAMAIDDLGSFLGNDLAALDLWSMPALLEALLARPDWRAISNELMVASRAILQSISDPIRLELCKAIFEVADLRLRDLAGNRDAPPYWRRMAAISHAAIVERAALGSGVDISSLSKWFTHHASRAFWATIPDMHREHRWGPVMMRCDQLRQECQ